MAITEIDKLRFCAFCPNVCRIYYPKGMPQWEFLTPSALAFLGYAVVKGFVVYTKEVEDTLFSLKACETAQKACPYNYDISGCLRSIFQKNKKEAYD